MEADVVGGFTFNEWIKQIDTLFRAEFWMGYQNFPDWCYYDDWVDGLTPQETFDNYCEEVGY